MSVNQLLVAGAAEPTIPTAGDSIVHPLRDPDGITAAAAILELYSPLGVPHNAILVTANGLVSHSPHHTAPIPSMPVRSENESIYQVGNFVRNSAVQEGLHIFTGQVDLKGYLVPGPVGSSCGLPDKLPSDLGS